jgi:mRNA interferase RelE/StbE
MNWEITYNKKSLEDLAKLPKNISQRIANKIKFFASRENPLFFAKRLQNKEIGAYRFRIGDYRAIFDIDTDGAIKILLILGVRHRKEIYRI